MTDQPFPGDQTSGDARDSGFDRSSEGMDAPGQGSLAFGAGVENADVSPARKKRGARKRPARKKATAGTQVAEADQASKPRPPESQDSDSGSGDEPKKRPRRSRGGRKRSAAKARAAEDGEPQTDSPPAGEADSDDAPPARKKRSRRRKPAAESKEGEGPTSPAEVEDSASTSEADFDPDGDGARRKRRRGSRGGRGRKKSKAVDPVSEAAPIDSIPGEEDDLPAIPDLPADAEMLDEGGTKRKRGRTSRKKKVSSSSDEGPTKKKASRGRSKATTSKESTGSTKPVERNQIIIVNAVDREEKRVAVVEDGKIVDFLMTAESQKTLVSDIYRGKVVNLEQAIGAAFVDFGQGRNGFLHTSDVLAIYGEDGFTLDKLLTATVDPDDVDEDSSVAGDEVDDTPDEDEDDNPKTTKKTAKRATKARRTSTRGRARQRLPISDLIKVGSPVVTQVTKDAIGDKGPTLTTYISIPGRYLVLMPSMARTGVSRKIEDEKERRRLKRILQSIDVPDGMGVIVRTAGIGQTKTDLKRDLNYLLGLWENFGKRLRRGRGPMPLYQESDLAVRTLRDLFNAKTEAVIVDDPMVYEQLIEFGNQLMPDQVDRIKLHDGDRPIFHHHGIEQEFEKIFLRRVELPCGGSVVFDQTEALVAIDVNSGRTRTETFDFEEIALKTNLDAVPEIARQIKLRDLGGIIVCDFIDMMRTSSMRQVERALRTELAGDRARSKLGRISQFGLLELTRQRLGPGTHKKVFAACPRCRSTGHIRSVPSRAAAILRRLGSALTQKGFSSVELRAHPEVVDYLQNDLQDYVRALEHRFDRKLTLTGVSDQTEDSVLRYLRADGREVRPGGRRRR